MRSGGPKVANNRIMVRAGSPWGFAHFMSGPGVTRRSLCVCFVSESDQNKFFIRYKVSFLVQLNILKSLCCLCWVSQGWEDAGIMRITINVTQMFVVNTRAVKITLINNTAVRSHGGTPARHFISTNIKYSSSPSQQHQSNWSPSLVVHICLPYQSSEIVSDSWYLV